MGIMKEIAIKSQELCEACGIWSESGFCVSCRQYIKTYNREGNPIEVEFNPFAKKIEEVRENG